MFTVPGMETGIALDEINLDELNKEVTLTRLQTFRGHRAKTARSLGISLRTLGMWLKRWGQDVTGLPETNVAEEVPEIISSEISDPIIKRIDLSSQIWREYRWQDPATGNMIRERFNDPIEVFFHSMSSTHRIVYKDPDGNILSSSVPAVGYFGCVITWSTRENAAPAAIV